MYTFLFTFLAKKLVLLNKTYLARFKRRQGYNTCLREHMKLKASNIGI